jgi:hypothetical protein
MPQDHRGRLEKAQIETNQKMVKWTAVVGVFTVVLALVSIVQGGFVLWQASTAANAAQDAREQLRALVSNTTTTIFVPDDIDKPGAQFGVVPTFQNFGGTRTQFFKAHASLKFFEDGIPSSLDLTKPYLDYQAGETIIGPNSPYQGFGVSISGAELRKNLNGVGQILYWGTAEYADIFNPKIVHHIRYCNLIKPQTNSDGKIVVQTAPYKGECNRND